MTGLTLVVLGFIALGEINGVNLYNMYPTTFSIIIALLILGNLITLYNKTK